VIEGRDNYAPVCPAEVVSGGNRVSVLTLKESEMKSVNYVMLALGIGTAVSGFGLKLLHADPVQNARCMTSLNPLVCNSEGNSYCNEVAGSTGNCNGACSYCPGDGAVPAKHCVNWEGSCCQTGGAGESECQVPDVEQVAGECNTSGSCICVNPQPNGNDCGNFIAMPSCSGNCS
jgi:hypothetical protein